MFEIFVVIAIIALAVASIVNVRSQTKPSEPEIVIRLDEHTNAQQMREQLDQYRVTKVTQR